VAPSPRTGALAQVVPRDGLRVRFHVIRDGQRLHMELDHDGYAKERPIVVADDLSSVRFVVENRRVARIRRRYRSTDYRPANTW
jgi:hypothetical protein